MKLYKVEIMLKFIIVFSLFALQSLRADAALIQDKVLICGVCKNVKNAVPNTIQSAKHLGEQFLDYEIVIYENNSTDKTKELFQGWANKDSHVHFISEDLSEKKMAPLFNMKVYNRTEAIARARNKVLDVVMQDKYEDFKYVVWADLDFLEPWSVDQIVETVLHPEQECDAVFANGIYDLFALRDPQFAIGFELIGRKYFQKINEIRSRLTLDPKGAWRKVYSAFGGMAIYKRKALQGCRYSGVVTKDLEKVVTRWLEEARASTEVCLLEDYDHLLSSTRIVNLYLINRVYNRNSLPAKIGMKLNNAHGTGKVAWFSCTRKHTLPWTCEHIPLHASMALRGHGKFFINPRWKSNHP